MPKPLLTLLTAVLDACLLAACAVGPDYRPPLIETPSAFMGQRAIDARGVAPAVVPTGDWWEGFDDPLLTKVVREALTQNLDLAQSVARVREARARRSNRRPRRSCRRAT